MTESLNDMERVFKAIADTTRLRILGLQVCVCHIHESLRIPQPKASRHLAYLRRAGLVTTRKDGLWVHDRLAAPTDPILITIQQAVTHAVRYLDAVQKDTDRLHKKTGCCLPPASTPAPPSFPCCGDAVAARGKIGAVHHAR